MKLGQLFVAVLGVVNEATMGPSGEKHSVIGNVANEFLSSPNTNAQGALSVLDLVSVDKVSITLTGNLLGIGYENTMTLNSDPEAIKEALSTLEATIMCVQSSKP